MSDAVSTIEVHVFWVRTVFIALRIVQDSSHVACTYINT